MHIYNFISATRAIVITIFTREPRNQVGVALLQSIQSVYGTPHA